MTVTNETPKVTADVKKTGTTVTGRFTFKNLPTFDVEQAKKPLFAYVGVADLALERAKEIPAELTELNKTVGTKVQALVAEVPAQAKALPVTVRTNVEKATEKATDLYAKLTVRGERLVTQIRRQPATEAAATAARKSAKAGEKAVEGAVEKIG